MTKTKLLEIQEYSKLFCQQGSFCYNVKPNV